MSHPRLFPSNFPILLGRIALALAVMLSSLAWLPSAAQAAAQPAPQAETSASPKVQAWILGSRLYVDASRLPGEHVFNLRARRGSSGSWTKLTSVKSNRQGEITKSVRLPNSLRQSFRLQVCLKDKKTDRVFCARARWLG
jgi:hypothetical protein